MQPGVVEVKVWQRDCEASVCVCLRIFLLRRVAGNLSIALWISKNCFFHLFFFRGCLYTYSIVRKYYSYIVLFCCFQFMVLISFAGHQGSSQCDPCTVTGFGSFKFPTCDWLQKRWSHSHTESSPVWWLHAMCWMSTYTWDYMWGYTCAYVWGYTDYTVL